MSTHTPKDASTSFKTDKIKKQKNTNFGTSDSVFVLTTPVEKKKSQDLVRGNKIKRSKLNSKLKEILHEI